jgi:uncharacterized protein YjbI with pentapeptide repeats
VFLGVVVGFFTLRHNRQLLQASRAEHLESLNASRDALEQTLAFNRESLSTTMAVTERGQITDRYSKAIEQLGQSGAKSIDLRLGGIYALEQIAKDSADWHQPVMEVLSAFVRQHAAGVPPPEGETIEIQRRALDLLPSRKYVPLRADVAAAITTLAQRDRSRDRSYIDLQGADFRRIDFPVNLDLSQTRLSTAHLQFSSLMYVELRDCHFLQTDLRGADLAHSDLRGATMSMALLDRADLEAAKLDGADLTRVNLRGVRNLNAFQLDGAKIDESTILPDNIDRGALLRQVRPEAPES